MRTDLNRAETIDDLARQCHALWADLRGLEWPPLLTNPDCWIGKWDDLLAAQQRLAHLACSAPLSPADLARVSAVELMILKEELHSRVPGWMARFADPRHDL